MRREIFSLRIDFIRVKCKKFASWKMTRPAFYGGDEISCLQNLIIS